MRPSYELQAYEKHMGLWRSLASEPLRWEVPGQPQRTFSALRLPPTNPPPPRWQKLGRVVAFLDRIVKVMAAQRSKKKRERGKLNLVKPALFATHQSFGCLRGAGGPGRADLSKAIAGQVPAEFALGNGSNSILLKSGSVALHKQQMSAAPSQPSLLPGPAGPRCAFCHIRPIAPADQQVHRTPVGRSPGRRGARARESEMLARMEFESH